MEVTTVGGVVVAGMFAGNPGSIGSFNYTGAYSRGDDAVIIKLNSSGVLEWYRLYGGIGNDRLNGIAIANDGGFVVSGRAGADVTSLCSFTTPNLRCSR